jgi:uncharacterized protein YbjT (DUF2867 family)
MRRDDSIAHLMGMERTILVAGASGALGRRVVKLLAARDWRVRALTRDPRRLTSLGSAVAEVADARALDRAVAGAEAVFSCLGAPVLPDPRFGWRGFRGVDLPINRALVGAAARAGVKKVTYVSCFHDVAMRRLAYIDAHEGVVDAMRASGLAWSVVRPTGFFSAIGSFLDMARTGPLPQFGRPEARTNPIHDDDLADICVEAVHGDVQEIDAGGPEVLSRGEMAELAFAALGKTPRYRRVPSWLMRAAAWILRPLHPRVADLLAFFNTIAARDLIAPLHGTRRLGSYLTERAAAGVNMGN